MFTNLQNFRNELRSSIKEKYLVKAISPNVNQNKQDISTNEEKLDFSTFSQLKGNQNNNNNINYGINFNNTSSLSKGLKENTTRILSRRESHVNEQTKLLDTLQNITSKANNQETPMHQRQQSLNYQPFNNMNNNNGKNNSRFLDLKEIMNQNSSKKDDKENNDQIITSQRNRPYVNQQQQQSIDSTSLNTSPRRGILKLKDELNILLGSKQSSSTNNNVNNNNYTLSYKKDMINDLSAIKQIKNDNLQESKLTNLSYWNTNDNLQKSQFNSTPILVSKQQQNSGSTQLTSIFDTQRIKKEDISNAYQNENKFQIKKPQTKQLSELLTIDQIREYQNHLKLMNPEEIAKLQPLYTKELIKLASQILNTVKSTSLYSSKMF